MSHPALSNGITDAQTTLVAAAGTLREAEEVRRMLNPGYADIEILSKGTELTPNLRISIVRTGSQGQPWTAEGVWEAVEFAERTMQLPLPLNHVIVVLNDKAFIENYGGTNFGFAFGYDPEDEQPRDTLDGYYFQSGNVHETAHYYWHSYADWIDEGVANTFEYMYGVETGVSPGLLEVTRRKDCEAHDLEMLTEWNPEQQELDRFHCNYFLGHMLFLELLENLGTDEFNAGLRELYRLSLAAKDTDETPGITEVRQAFRDHNPLSSKSIGPASSTPRRTAPLKRAYTGETTASSSGTRYPTYDGEYVTFSGTLLGNAVLSNETIEQARKGGKQNFIIRHAEKGEFAGFILPPLDDGRNWTLKYPGDNTAIEYWLGGRTFTIKFPSPESFGDPSDYVVIVRGFQNERREPFIRDDIDYLGYARIRLE